MSEVASSPLSALIQYYERLQRSSEVVVSSYGFAPTGVSFCIVLEPDGSIASIEDLRVEGSTRNVIDRSLIPRQMIVPFRGNRSSPKPPPNFLCDNTGFVLGADSGSKKELLTWKHSQCVEFHKSFNERVVDGGLDAVCRFLQSWVSDSSSQLEQWHEIRDTNVTFRLRGVLSYVHQSPVIQEAWLQYLAEPETELAGPSLISGEVEPLARLHEPAIKNVYDPGGQAEKRLVCFKKDAFKSYNKSQSYNAPVGVRDAFRYTTALNHLLADGSRRVRIGDATVVFWSDSAEGSEAEGPFRQMFGDEFSRADPAEHAATVDRVRGFLDAARQGRLGDRIAGPDAPFYILGLSPNASRLNVRYWLAGTVAQFAERLARHMSDLKIGGAPDEGAWISIQSILAETARERKDIAPQLAGSVARAILEGLPSYPEALLNGIIRRIRADGQVSWRRAAILKAFLVREGRFGVDVYLNKQHTEKSYHCGRLLAVLSFAQEQALGSVNSGVVRRNLGSVMSMPGLMLGRLQRAAEVGHIPKLERDLPVFVRDEIKAINVRLRDNLPNQLSMREQGVFALGFYQELQYLDFVGAQVRQNKRVRTIQGEWVRSRKEARVAEALAKLGLEYIYEPAAILEGRERWPDFVVRRGPGEDLYIEVLGMNTDEYNETWNTKARAYESVGITQSGGPKGHLIVLDFRTKDFDSIVVLDLLRPYLTNS